MRFLVFQHIAIEHPGIFRDFFAADGIAWDAVELDAGESIPSFDGYDALWVMGGPMDVWETDQHPWLVREMQAIRIGRHAYGMQYHTELTPATVGEWGDVPAYACALDQTLGPGALPRFDAEARRHMADFNRDSRRIYDNFMKATGLR